MLFQSEALNISFVGSLYLWCQPAIHIVPVGVNSGCLMLPVRLAKSEKSGILNKNVDITALNLVILPKYTEGLQ